MVIGAVAENNGSASDVQDAILETLPGLQNLLRLLSASVLCDEVPSEHSSGSEEEEDDESSSAGPSPAKRRRTDEGPTTTVSKPSGRET